MKASRLASSYGSVVRIIEAVGIAIVLIEGGIMALGGLITVGILVSFVFYVQEFFDPVVMPETTCGTWNVRNSLRDSPSLLILLIRYPVLTLL